MEELKEVDIPLAPSKEQEQEEELDIELGDRVELIGGRYTKTRGIVYYNDDDLIRIMPDGLSDRLIDLPIGEEGIDPELGLEEIKILKKRTVTTFISIADLRVGQSVETFTAAGEQGPLYKTTRVNDKEDTADMEGQTGDSVEDFIKPFVGLRRELPFAVIRTQDPPKPVEVNEAPVVEEEGEDFEVLEDLEVPIFEEIQAIPTAFRTYPDVIQKTDMFQDLIKGIEPSQQKNPNRLRELRRLVESMALLRNDIIEYGRSGNVEGQKSVSFQTLSELLEKTEFPLAKQVLGVAKVLYLDHSLEHIESRTQSQKAEDDQGGVDPIHIADNAVQIQYLEDVVRNSIQYYDAQMSTQVPKTAGLTERGLPRWHTVWQSFFNEYMKSTAPNTQGDTVQIRNDREFFRAQVPQDPNDPPELTGFTTLPNERVQVSVDFLSKIHMGIQRAIGPRYGRNGERKTYGIVEAGDEAEVLSYVLFPLLFTRDLGTIRSGNLAIDVGQAAKEATLMTDILKSGGQVSNIPSTNGILAVSYDGSSLGNIEISDWLKGQTLYGNGIGSILPYLKSFGLSGVELTVDQKAILDKKVETYRSGIKKMIADLRTSVTNEVVQIKNESLLSLEEETTFFKTIEGEPLLLQVLQEFVTRYPAYAANDIARFAAVYEKHADLLLATLGGSAQGVAIERTRAVRDQFLEALRNSLAMTLKTELEGEAPIPNRCSHVESLEAIRKIKNPDDRMKLLVKFVNQFRSEKRDNWIWCAACNQHLICEHEFLILQEFLHPREKEILHKQLLLNFSGGDFQGKYICKHCGQAISDIEFDTSLEYDDEGRPMMGRSVLVDQDALDDEELAKALSVEKEDEVKIDFKDQSLNLIYRSINEIANMVGVYPDHESYDQMVKRVGTLVGKLPGREAYGKAIKASAASGAKGKALDYDIYLNRNMVSYCSGALLIDIQTKRPDYVIRYTLQGCSRPEFTGYPMTEDSKAGIEYLSCAIASIARRENPWDLTGFQAIRTDKDRLKTVSAYVESGVKALILLPDVQQSIATKKQYLLETFGSEASAGRPKDSIPDSFTPHQIIVSVQQEESAAAPTVEAAATPLLRAQAWIVEGHKIARTSGKYLPGNPFSEASCCYSPLMAPGSFWQQAAVPVLEKKAPPQGFNGSLLYVHMKPRMSGTLIGKADTSIMYRLFMRLCFMGPEDHIGLPHEPGYNGICAFCGFKFPEDPRLPPPVPVYVKDGGLQKKYDEEFKNRVAEKEQKELAALQSQGIVVSVDTFEELLDASHRKFLVEPVLAKSVPLGMEMFQSLLSLNPPPFEEFLEVMNDMITKVGSLPPDADKAQMAIAYGSVSEKAREFEEDLEKRLKGKYSSFTYLLGLSPQSLGETLRSYFLIPFQRALTGIDLKLSMVVQKSYKLSTETVGDIQGSLQQHVDYITKFASELIQRDDKATFAKAKVEELVDRLSAVLPLFTKKLRANLVPAGSLGLEYIQRILISGIFKEFLDPNHVPLGSSEVAPIRSVVSQAELPIQMFATCLMKLKTEGLDFTGEQIRTMIAERNEKEKAKIINDLDGMSKEAKSLELLNKKLGLGKWAVGGTKAIYAYDPEQYEREKQERLAAGIMDMSMEPQGRAVDADGFTVGAEEEGVDHTQTREDDA